MEIILILLFWLGFSIAAGVHAGKKGGAGAFVGVLFCSLFLSPLIGWLVAVSMKKNEAALGLKKCPACAEYVKPDANVCRYCGTRFVGVVPNAAAPPLVQYTGAAPLSRKTKILWSVVLLVLIGVMICGLVLFK